MDKKKRSKAAAELGRRGGLKGGAARARALTPEQRREISKKANAVRWGVPKEQIITDDITWPKPVTVPEIAASLLTEITKEQVAAFLTKYGVADGEWVEGKIQICADGTVQFVPDKPGPKR